MITEHQLIEYRPRTDRGTSLDSRRPEGFQPEGEAKTAEKVARSLAYMEENLNRPLQVSALAAHANVSPSHYFALFKQLTGRPPMDYFTRLRMRRACRLLDSTTASVKEVAAALGYDDPFYFSRVFKSVNQMPPSQYRATKANFAGVTPRIAAPRNPWSPVLT